MSHIKNILLILLVLYTTILPQFGKNKVQYREHNWSYIQTKHFDIYFTEEGNDAAEYAATSAEEALADIEKKLDYQINNRISLIVYNSHNEFQETNTSDGYLSQGIGGFTEPFKNRVVFPFEGSFSKYKHVIHHELVHAVMRDFLYGGTIQNIIAKGITLQLPIWYHEGMAEFLSSGWETNSDMFIRDAAINEYLPDIKRLSGYYAYRGGQALFKYIADTYGIEKIAELLYSIKAKGSLKKGLKASIGIDLDELNEKWKKSIKKEFWPDVAIRKDPEEFAKRLTDNKKLGGFYNTSPAISPKGDKIVIISDRDIYLDVYLINSFDGKEIKKVIESGTTENLEELNVLFPSLTWAPDNKRIALSSKSEGYDVIKIIDTDTDDDYNLPFKFPGIESVSWSPDGKYIAFLGSNAHQSDIYIYNFSTKKVTNLTNDIFSDYLPNWSPDSKSLIFSSDRGDLTKENFPQDGYSMAQLPSYQMDLFKIDIETKKITRITDWQFSDEKSAVFSSNGKEIIFISDYNGIDNLYKKRIVLEDKDTVNSVLDLPAVPLTNSLNGISSVSISKDTKKLVFSTLFNAGYNVFLINNPFLLKKVKKIEMTEYMSQFYNKNDNQSTDSTISLNKITITDGKEFIYYPAETEDSTENINPNIFTGQIIDEGEKGIDTSAIEDYSNFAFADEKTNNDSTNKNLNKSLFSEKLDDEGNFLVHKYKVNFSPDLIYANAGFSSLYGVLGTTVLSFSDVLGNHRLIGTTSLQIDLKNSDYGLAYYYLPKRINYGFQAYHTARFVLLNSIYGIALYRFRSYGAFTSASLPINTFHRIDASLSLQRVSKENLDILEDPTEKETFIIPSLSYVKDNTLWGYTSPIQGERYKINIFGNPGFTNTKRSFFSITWDYRKYFRFFYDYSFAIRFSGGYSGGANPQRFFLGGTESWINRRFATRDIPLSSAADFIFLTPAMPLRGYNYAEQLGTKYSLINLELRMPLIRYLVTGPLPVLFQNIMGVAFLDVGSAWEQNKNLKLFTKTALDETVTKDLLIGTGFGARIYFMFLWKFDVAWTYNLKNFSGPKYYISIGLDF